MRVVILESMHIDRNTDRDKNLLKTVGKWRGYILSAMVLSQM